LEDTPEKYVAKLVEIFREVRRVLRKDGTFWLNLGDSYAGGGRAGNNPEYQEHHTMFGKPAPHRETFGIPMKVPDNLKPKDLCEIPSDVARALRSDGWYLRSRIPWLKRNSMPESCEDRPSSAVEYIFELTKSRNYYYDNEAVKKKSSSPGSIHVAGDRQKMGLMNGIVPQHDIISQDSRNRRNSDWFFESWQGLLTDEEGDPLALVVNPSPYKEAHFATFPPMLVEPLILAGTSQRGCCAKCGAPWDRVIEQTGNRIQHHWAPGTDVKTELAKGKHGSTSTLVTGYSHEYQTLGWRPTCSCYGLEIIEDQPTKPSKKKDESDADYDNRLKIWEQELNSWYERWESLKPLYEKQSTIPCLVLDPFVGSGTVCKVAMEHGRRSVGIDLSLAYIKLAQKRTDTDKASLGAFDGKLGGYKDV
jgi:DNA modification methylase